MIVETHSIGYRNVASKLYNFFPDEIDVAINDFVGILTRHGYNPTGTIFFSIISDPTAEVMTAEIFLPILENNFKKPTEEEVSFNSYFLIKPMLMTRIMDNFDEQSQVKYWELIHYIQRKNLIQKTPVFAEFKRSYKDRSYVEMSVGI
ncbi:DUF5085 family protein [Pueribacillus sp. YX66]|uniref:DUF5085 family protein n=1 Tax=Pueribacillus sp. YX66 TaxID=3229242 RepID=UPI00358CF4E4